MYMNCPSMPIHASIELRIFVYFVSQKLLQPLSAPPSAGEREHMPGPVPPTRRYCYCSSDKTLSLCASLLS